MDPLRFNPFETTALQQMADELGRQGDVTPTPPIEPTLLLIDRSVRWISYGEDLLKLWSLVVEAEAERRSAPEQISQERATLAAYLAEHEPKGTIPTRAQGGGRVILIGDIAKATGIRKSQLSARGALAPEMEQLRDRMASHILSKSREDPEELITIAEAAREWGFTQAPLYVACREGLLPFEMIDGLIKVRRKDRLYKKKLPGKGPYAGRDEPGKRTRALIEKFEPVHRGPGEPWPLLNGFLRRGVGQIDLHTAVNWYLPTACIVVIAAFTARRHEEMKLIEHTSETPAIWGPYGDRWLRCWIEKTLQCWDDVPVPEVVCAAVDLLIRWSEAARVHSGRSGIFQHLDRSGSTVQKFNIYKLNEFAVFVGAVPGGENPEWTFSPHQFRKFFAVLYMWRYKAGRLDALAYHLRHFSMEMTRRYLESALRGAMRAGIESDLEEVMREGTMVIITNVVSGEMDAGGGAAARLKASYARWAAAARLIEIVPERRAAAWAERFVAKTGIRLKPMLWGFCSCGTTRHQTGLAKCQKGQDLDLVRGPDFARASPTVCAFCPFNLTGSDFAEFWLAVKDDYLAAAEAPTSAASLSEMAAVNADILQRYIDSAVLQRTNAAR